MRKDDVGGVRREQIAVAAVPIGGGVVVAVLGVQVDVVPAVLPAQPLQALRAAVRLAAVAAALEGRRRGRGIPEGDVRQRLEIRGDEPVAESGPRLSERGVDLEARGLHGGVDDCLGLVPVDRADGVGDRAARAHPGCCGEQELELELGQRLGTPAQVGPRREHAEPRAGRVDESAVEPVQVVRQVASVGADDARARGTEPAQVLRELAGPALVHLDRYHVARQHGRLATGCGTEVEHPLPRFRPDREGRELGAGALRPDAPLRDRVLVDVLDVPGTGDVRVRLACDLTADDPHHGGGRAVLGLHQCARLAGAEVAPPRLGDPVGVGVRERSLPGRRVRKLLHLGPALGGEAPEDGVREGHRALEPSPAHELHRLVHGRVARDAVEEDELEGAEAQRRPHRRVEAPDGPPADRLDRVIERAGSLHGAVSELPRESAVAVAQPGGRAAEGAVGVCLALEDPQQHVEGSRARG